MAISSDSTVVLPCVKGWEASTLTKLHDLFQDLNLGEDWDDDSLPDVLSEGHYFSRTMNFDDKDRVIAFAKEHRVAIAVHQDAHTGDHESDFPGMLYWFDPARGEDFDSPAGRHSMEPHIPVSALLSSPAALEQYLPPACLGLVPR